MRIVPLVALRELGSVLKHLRIPAFVWWIRPRTLVMVLLAFGVSRSGFSLRVRAQCFVHGRQNLEEVGHLYLHIFHPVVKVCNLLLKLKDRGVQCGYTVPALRCVHGGGAIESWGAG